MCLSSDFGQAGIFSCFPYLPLLIFFRVIPRANMENGVQYFPFFAHYVVIYAKLTIPEILS